MRVHVLAGFREKVQPASDPRVRPRRRLDEIGEAPPGPAESVERVVVDSREWAREKRDDGDVVVRILDRREEGTQLGETLRDRKRSASRPVTRNAERLEIGRAA